MCVHICVPGHTPVHVLVLTSFSGIGCLMGPGALLLARLAEEPHNCPVSAPSPSPVPGLQVAVFMPSLYMRYGDRTWVLMFARQAHPKLNQLLEPP